MTLDRSEHEESCKPESANRRQFLHNAMRIGGAAALLLTGASRDLLAKSLTLNSQEMEAARRARQTPGAPSYDEQDARRAVARSATAAMRAGGCSGGCEGDCKGCSGACTHSCSGDCLGGCSGGCKGACAGGCKGGCEGTCQGTGVG